MSIPRTLPKEIEDLFNSSKTANIKRVQVYQQADNSGSIQPSSLIRFNIPADSIADFRDSYVLLDLGFTGNPIAQVADVLNFTPVDTTGAAVALSNLQFSTFMLSYKGYVNGPVNGISAIPFWASASLIAQYLLTIPTFKLDFNVYNMTDFNQVFGIVNNNNTANSTTWPVANPPVAPYSIVITNNSKTKKFVAGGAGEYLQMTNIIANNSGPPAYNVKVQFTVTNGHPAFPRLDYGSGSIIDRVQVEFNSEVFCEIENYNRLWNIISDLKLVDHRRCSGTLLYNEGIGLEGYWSGYKRLAIPLYGVGILQSLFPLNLVNGLQFRITLRLADPHIALVNYPVNDGTQSYQVQNCEFHYHSVQVDKSVNDLLLNKLNSGGLVYGFENYLSFSDTLVGSTSDKILNFNVRSFLGVLAVMQQQDFISDWSNEHKCASFIKNSIQSFRLKVGSDYYPKNTVQLLQRNPGDIDSPMDVTQPFIELMRFFGIYRPLAVDSMTNDEALCALNYWADTHDQIYLDSYIIDRSNFPSFIIGISTDAEARELEKSYHQMNSGVDVSGQTSVTLELRNYSLQSANTIYTFGKFQGACVLTRNGATYLK